MTRTRIILTNDFHRTETSVIAIDGIVSVRAFNRAKKKLCGISECTCGQIRPYAQVGDWEPINIGGPVSSYRAIKAAID
jgi:hypothetical protein